MRAAIVSSAFAAVACGSAPARPPIVTPAPGPSEAVIAGTARVSGRLVAADGRPLLSGTVVMRPAVGTAGGHAADATLLPDGRFSFTNVRPGRYEIRARGATDREGHPLFATFALVIDGRDIEHIQLTLAPGATIDGSVRFEASTGAKPPALRTIRVRAPLAGAGAPDDFFSAPVAANGSFALAGLPPGAHAIAIEGLSGPWLLAHAEYHGRDVTDRPLDLQAGDRLHDVRVVVSDRAAALDVRVTAERGDAPADRVTVLLFPADPQFWSSRRRRRAATTGADGRCHFDRLPDGAYLAIAGRGLDRTTLDAPDKLEALHGLATPVLLAAAETGRLQIAVVPSVPRTRAFNRSASIRRATDHAIRPGRRP